MNRETHLEADDEDYLERLLAEDRRRARRRRLTWLIGIGIVLLAAILAAVLGYRWTQNQFYVGQSNGRVAVYQGVQASLGPFALSSVIRDTDIEVADLPAYHRARVERTITAGSVERANAIVANLESVASPRSSTAGSGGSTPTRTPSPEPPAPEPAQ